MIHEGFADTEEIALRRDSADIVQEFAFGIDADADEVGVFLHLLHLGGFAEVLRWFRGFEKVTQVIENVAAARDEGWFAAEVVANLSEEPGIANRATADHQTARSGNLQHFLGFRGAVDVPVGEDRAMNCLNGAGDEIVMDFAAIHLGDSAGVDGEEIDLMLRENGEEFVEDGWIIESYASLDRKRNGDGFTEGAEN